MNGGGRKRNEDDFYEAPFPSDTYPGAGMDHYPPLYPGPPGPPGGMYPGFELPRKKTNTLAIVSLILGGVSMFLGMGGLVCSVLCLLGPAICFIGTPVAIGGLLCGIVANVQIRRDPAQSGKKLAITGIILNSVFLGLMILTIILGGIFLFAFLNAPGT